MARGVTFRTATLDDAELIAGVLDECTMHYFDRPSSTADALERLQWSERDGDALIACDEPGRALGFGHLWEPPSDEVRCYVRVRPSAKGRGVATALLTQFVARARELPARVLTLTSWAEDPDAAPLLESQGFSAVRYFVQMRIDLSTIAAWDVAWPGGIELRAYDRDQDDAELFAAHTDAFAEHWGQEAVEETDWWDELRDAANAGFEPSLWFLAWAGEAIAGFSICREREEDEETVGWISTIGVRPAWRGRGLGDALLAHSLQVFRERGLDRAALNVDAENTTGALRLYRKAGMEPKPAFTVWSLPLS